MPIIYWHCYSAEKSNGGFSMTELLFEKVADEPKPYVEPLRQLLEQIRAPFTAGDSVGIKLHWGERGNKSFLPPDYAKGNRRLACQPGNKTFCF